MSTEEKTAPAENAAARTAGRAQDKREARLEAFFARLPRPCVYCGPSVQGVARQYTVYSAGVPEAVKDFIREHPSARGLLVSVERFPQVRRDLETPGTVEQTLFQNLRTEL